MKSHASVVAIGGGVVGASVLFHLARAGWTDAMLIERSELTSGSGWYAAVLDFLPQRRAADRAPAANHAGKLIGDFAIARAADDRFLIWGSPWRGWQGLGRRSATAGSAPMST